MEKIINNSPQLKRRGKDNNFEAQMKQVFAAFYEHPKTMLMVSIETCVFRANICRYVAMWKRNGSIKIVGRGICPISKHSACFYTTNPELNKLNVKTLNGINI